MAQSRSTEISLLAARHKIFNKLCSAYRRSGQNPNFGLLAYDVMVDLAIPLNVFGEALDGFADVRGELIVEMFQRKGERYIRLGQTAKYNCSDWSAPLELFFFGFEC